MFNYLKDFEKYLIDQKVEVVDGRIPIADHRKVSLLEEKFRKVWLTRIQLSVAADFFKTVVVANEYVVINGRKVYADGRKYFWKEGLRDGFLPVFWAREFDRSNNDLSDELCRDLLDIEMHKLVKVSLKWSKT